MPARLWRGEGKPRCGGEGWGQTKTILKINQKMIWYWGIETKLLKQKTKVMNKSNIMFIFIFLFSGSQVFSQSFCGFKHDTKGMTEFITNSFDSTYKSECITIRSYLKKVLSLKSVVNSVVDEYLENGYSDSSKFIGNKRLIINQDTFSLDFYAKPASSMGRAAGTCETLQIRGVLEKKCTISLRMLPVYFDTTKDTKKIIKKRLNSTLMHEIMHVVNAWSDMPEKIDEVLAYTISSCLRSRETYISLADQMKDASVKSVRRSREYYEANILAYKKLIKSYENVIDLKIKIDSVGNKAIVEELKIGLVESISSFNQYLEESKDYNSTEYLVNNADIDSHLKFYQLTRYGKYLSSQMLESGEFVAHILDNKRVKFIRLIGKIKIPIKDIKTIKLI